MYGSALKPPHMPFSITLLHVRYSYMKMIKKNILYIIVERNRTHPKRLKYLCGPLRIVDLIYAPINEDNGTCDIIVY